MRRIWAQDCHVAAPPPPPPPLLVNLLLLMLVLLDAVQQSFAECIPREGCTALAWYRFTLDEQLNLVFQRFGVNLEQLRQFTSIPQQDLVEAGQEILIPFQCSCTAAGDYLAHNFTYTNVSAGDSMQKIVQTYYHNLSNVDAAAAFNGGSQLVYPGSPVNVPVNCSCGSPADPEFGLFMTYPAQPGDTSSTIASKFNTSVRNLTLFNPASDLSRLRTNDVLFIPAKYVNGTYPRFRGDRGSSDRKAAVIGASVGGAAAVLLVLAALLWWFFAYRKREKQKVETYAQPTGRSQAYSGSQQDLLNTNGVPPGLSDLAVDKSVEFSYEELATATNNFSVAHKIGQGGYGSVYYGEIRDLRLAIKMMNLQATREFMSELKVLTRVHHTNLVQLIGYCTGDYLFLVYEYVNNGTLAQHLRGSVAERLSWSRRVQIALDAARGLEYIHEHTKPTYIHRDVKSPNILIDKNYRAKVADFGLTKLTESTVGAGGGSNSLTMPTRLVGTFGYMPPEYARFGDVSPKIDVYSFGVVLYEIVSAKDAIVRGEDPEEDNGSSRNLPRGLVTMFDDVLKGSAPMDDLRQLVDPALGDSYPFDSVWKVTKLAEACTQETPENRPSMRTVVVALMTLCGSADELNTGTLSGNQIGPR